MNNLDEFFSKLTTPEKYNAPPAPDPPSTQHTHDTPNTPKQERFIEMFRMYEESRKQSELLRSRINHGINNKESHTELLLLSLECIALITGEKIFFTENKKKIAPDKER